MLQKTTRDYRRLILEAARKRFLSDGIKKTTMESIASDNKISKKTLYAFFSTKQDVWDELIKIESKKTCEYLKTHLSNDLNPLLRLEKLIGYYLRRRLQTDVEARHSFTSPVFIGAIATDPEDTAKILREEALQSAFPQLVADLVNEAQQQRLACDGDPILLTEMIVGCVMGATNDTMLGSDRISFVALRIKVMLQN